jgi:hypothetical protein
MTDVLEVLLLVVGAIADESTITFKTENCD